MKYYILIIGVFLGCGCHLLQGQTLDRYVFSSGGEAVQAGNLELVFTIGEPLILTLTHPEAEAGHGFHQDPQGSVNTAVEGLPANVSHFIFPNPASETLWLEMEGPELDYRLVLYAASGQRVSMAEKVLRGSGKQQVRFDLSGLTTGAYFILVADPVGNWKASIPFVKQ